MWDFGLLVTRLSKLSPYTTEVAQIIGRLHTLYRQGHVSADTLAQMRAAKPLAPALLSWVPE